MLTLCYSICKTLHDSESTQTHLLGILYGGLGLPLLMAALLSIDMIVWEAFHINYRFIFELDHRNVLHNSEYNTVIQHPVSFILTPFLVCWKFLSFVLGFRGC